MLKKLSVTLGALALVGAIGAMTAQPAQADRKNKYCVCHEDTLVWDLVTLGPNSIAGECPISIDLDSSPCSTPSTGALYSCTSFEVNNTQGSLEGHIDHGDTYVATRLQLCKFGRGNN
jgi:hypothetical protein